MTITKQPLSTNFTSEKIDPLAHILESLALLEAEMEDFEEIAEVYFQHLKEGSHETKN